MIDDLAQHLATARLKVEVGDYQGAAHASAAILADRPNCLLALRIQAYATLELGWLPAAEASFRSCASIDPEDELAHIGLAMCAEQQGELDQASAEFCRAWELAPNDPAIADEAELGQPLIGPTGDNRLARGVARRVVVQPALWTGLGVAPWPDTDVDRVDRTTVGQRLPAHQSKEPVGVDSATGERSVDAPPAAAV